MEAPQPSDVPPSAEEEPRKNIHLDVSPQFHRELKMITAFKGMTLRDYGIQALEEKLASDQAKIASGKPK